MAIQELNNFITDTTTWIINPSPSFKERYSRTMVMAFISLFIFAICFHFFHEPHYSAAFFLVSLLFILITNGIALSLDIFLYKTVAKMEFDDKNGILKVYQIKITNELLLDIPYNELNFKHQRFIRNRYTNDKEKQVELRLFKNTKLVAHFENSQRLSVSEVNELIAFMRKKFPSKSVSA